MDVDLAKETEELLVSKDGPTEYDKHATSIRLQFPKFSKDHDIEDFETFIQKCVGKENLVSLGRLAYPNEFSMELSSQEVRETLIRMAKTKIKNRSCWISPLSAKEIRGYIHWLPTAVTNEEIKTLLTPFGDVLFIETQSTKIWSSTKKVRSNTRYFALFLKSGIKKEDIPHFIKVESLTGLIIVKGRAPVCFHCRETGHRNKDCRKFFEKRKSHCGKEPNSEAPRKKPRGKRFKKNIVVTESENLQSLVASVPKKIKKKSNATLVSATENVKSQIVVKNQSIKSSVVSTSSISSVNMTQANLDISAMQEQVSATIAQLSMLSTIMSTNTATANQEMKNMTVQRGNEISVSQDKKKNKPMPEKIKRQFMF